MTTQDVEGEGLSVHVMRALGTRLVSKEVAVKFAELLLLDRHGQAELDRQSPLQAEAEGDRWVVTGSCSRPDVGAPTGSLGPGCLSISISQIDGRVYDFKFVGGFPSIESDVV